MAENLASNTARLIQNGWVSRYQNVAGTPYCIEHLEKEGVIIDICFIRSRVENDRRHPERFLSASVTESHGKFEIKTLRKLSNWINQKILGQI